MSYGFVLRPRRPRAPEGYSQDALSEMEAVIARWPAYKRSDGCWVLCDDYERRDEIIAEGTIDQRRHIYDHIRVKAEKVSFEVGRNEEHNRMFAAFISWSISKWPGDFYDEFDRPRTMTEFLRDMSPDQP